MEHGSREDDRLEDDKAMEDAGEHEERDDRVAGRVCAEETELPLSVNPVASCEERKAKLESQLTHGFYYLAQVRSKTKVRGLRARGW